MKLQTQHLVGLFLVAYVVATFFFIWDIGRTQDRELDKLRKDRQIRFRHPSQMDPMLEELVLSEAHVTGEHYILPQQPDSESSDSTSHSESDSATSDSDVSHHVSSDELPSEPPLKPEEDLDSSTDEDTNPFILPELFNAFPAVAPNPKVMVFYYPWYGSESEDFLHWAHEVLDDSHHKHVPPEDIGASHYPSLGLYSSSNPQLVDAHFKMIAQSGVGVVVVSWWSPQGGEGQGSSTDPLMPMLLDMAVKHGITVAIHLEPYNKRSESTVVRDMKYIYQHYIDHPGLAKIDDRPVVFVYDSYLISTHKWSTALSNIAHAKVPGFFIGLLVNDRDWSLLDAGFDGMYSYFAVDGFTTGSRQKSWHQFHRRASEKGKIFVPCPGPGYDDRRIRPWNARNMRDRARGQYYSQSLHAAVASGSDFIAITSFNEHHEGTNIEPCADNPPQTPGIPYLTYFDGPMTYMKMTADFVSSLSK